MYMFLAVVGGISHMSVPLVSPANDLCHQTMLVGGFNPSEQY